MPSSAPDKQVLNTYEVAQILGKTESSIRHALAGRAPWLPPAFKMGRRWAWRRQDVDAHLARLAAGDVPKAARVGRPRRAYE